MESVNLNWLHRARRQMHLSVDRVAEMVGKNKSTISRYENGITPMTVEMLFKLLAIYRLSVLDVVTKDGDGASDCI